MNAWDCDNAIHASRADGDRAGPEFVAVYKRPAFAYRLVMPCGHALANVDYLGRCAVCLVVEWRQRHGQ